MCLYDGFFMYLPPGVMGYFVIVPFPGHPFFVFSFMNKVFSHLDYIGQN